MRKIALLQHGDFLAAARNFAQNGEATYYAQKYSVEFVENLTKQGNEVMVVCISTTSPYEEMLPGGVKCVGIPGSGCGRTLPQELLRLVKTWGATDVVVCWPSREVISSLIQHGVRVLPLLADSFPKLGFRSWLGRWRLARLLSGPGISIVPNHQVPACRDLVRIGVPSEKIIPWDWPSLLTPDDYPEKQVPRIAGKLSVMFAGVIIEAKGIGDTIRAVARLARSGRDIRLSVAGSGEISRFKELAASEGVESRVEFLGRIPHRQVVQLMHEHDAVVVPSQHAYNEGLPMTIQDAFTSRTPLVASDHPMFMSSLQPEQSALIFPAQNDAALAECLARLADNPTLYSSLSRESKAAWQRLRIPVIWGELLTRWLRWDPADSDWLLAQSLARYPYS